MRLILFILLLSVFSETIAQESRDSVFNALADAMNQRHVYDQQKEIRLAGLKALLESEGKRVPIEEQYRINSKLIEEYWAYSFDSTFAYVNRNLAIAAKIEKQDWGIKAHLKLAALLAFSGRHKESQDILSRIDRQYLNDRLKVRYYECYRKIYSNLDYFALLPDSKEEYGRLYDAYTDSIMPLIQQDEDMILGAREWKLLDEGNYDECLRVNSLRLSRADIATEKYSYITFQRSMIYQQMSDRQQEEEYLALSAISDIMASRKDNASLAKLALRSYEDKDLEKAYQYIRFSFEDAIFYNSKVRFVEIASSLSLIMEAHQTESDKKNRALLIFTVIVSMFSVVLFTLLYFVYRQKKNLQEAQLELRKINEKNIEVNVSLETAMSDLKLSYQDLAESNHIKELYIGNFMNICSDFIDKMDNYRLTVNKLLRAKKYQQLFDMTKSVEAIEEEIEIFYTTFDKTFLSIYPTFVTEFNELLVEAERFSLKSNDILNPELRIFAVIRLGIKDSARIAQLLRYSVNTIYNYRVRIKNKASGNREEFENQVMRIGAHKLF